MAERICRVHDLSVLSGCGASLHSQPGRAPPTQDFRRRNPRIPGHWRLYCPAIERHFIAPCRVRFDTKHSFPGVTLRDNLPGRAPKFLNWVPVMPRGIWRNGTCCRSFSPECSRISFRAEALGEINATPARRCLSGAPLCIPARDTCGWLHKLVSLSRVDSGINLQKLAQIIVRTSRQIIAAR